MAWKVTWTESAWIDHKEVALHFSEKVVIFGVRENV
jgi:hypothetical protein